MNTAEIIRKVTMMLESTRIKISISLSLLVYFIFAVQSFTMWKKHTWCQLVAFWWTLVRIVEVCKYKRERNKSFSRFPRNLKTPTRTWKCTRWTMQMNYSYASDLLFKNFCKLAKRAKTISNYEKQVLVMIRHCLANSQINSIPEWTVFLQNRTFLYRTSTKVYA